VKFAFIDTNIFLHYAQPDEVDWCGVLGADSVTLVVAPVVIRELNNKKDTPGPKKTRVRAASALRWLGQFIGKSSPQIRKNVDVLLQPHDPHIDFNKFRLSQAINDDWLIAALLEFIQEAHAQNVLLATEDIGLIIKAQAHGIATQQLPEALKLPEEVEPAEKRAKELEEELRRLRNAMPDLYLVFDDDKSYVNVQLPSAPVFTSQSLREKIDEVKRKCPKLSKPTGYSGADLIRGVVLVPEEIDEYNRSLDNYFRLYEEYLEKKANYELLKWGTVRLQIKLLDRGSAPAKDVDVRMHFPDGFGLYDEDGLRKAIIMPREPARPKTRLEGEASDAAALISAIESFSLTGLSPPTSMRSMKTMYSNVGYWSIRQKDSFDTYAHVKELKHYLRTSLEPLFVVFPSRDAAKSFSIDYDLIAANVPEKINGKLHLVVEMP